MFQVFMHYLCHFYVAVSTGDATYLFLLYLRDRVRLAKGNIVSFRASQIANVVANDYLHHSVNLRQLSKKIRELCELMCDLKLMFVLKRCARGKVYAISRDSLLFKILQNCDDNTLMCIVEKFKELQYCPNKYENAEDFVKCLVSCCDMSEVWGKSL